MTLQQRKRLLIDRRLQGRLLAALVVLEVSMLALAIGYLYLRFDTIIESNLYSIHGSQREQLGPAFMRELGYVILVMAIINTVALLVADRLWMRHIQGILGHFRAGLKRFASLDFRPLERAVESDHEVLTQLHRWQDAERRRVRQYLDLTSDLPAGCEGPISEAQRQAMRRRLRKAKALLVLHREPG